MRLHVVVLVFYLHGVEERVRLFLVETFGLYWVAERVRLHVVALAFYLHGAEERVRLFLVETFCLLGMEKRVRRQMEIQFLR